MNRKEAAVILVGLLIISILGIGSVVIKAAPDNYYIQGTEPGDSTAVGSTDWDPGTRFGWIGCNDIPVRVTASYFAGDSGTDVTIWLQGTYQDTSGNFGLDYFKEFWYNDPQNILTLVKITYDTPSHTELSLTKGTDYTAGQGGGPGTGDKTPGGGQVALKIEYTLTFHVGTVTEKTEVGFYWLAHMALSPNGAAEWSASENLQAMADTPGGLKTLNIKRPTNVITTTTITTTATTTSHLTTDGDTTLTTSTTSETTETSITNPTATAYDTTVTVCDGTETTDTWESTWTTSWTRSTISSLISESTSEGAISGATTITELVSVTTTSTTSYTTTGSVTGGTAYQTVVVKFWVREYWLETVISGIISLITRIYNIIFEIKVDPMVGRTVQVVEICETTPRAPPIGGAMASPNKLAVLAPYLAGLIGLVSLTGAVFAYKRRRKA